MSGYVRGRSGTRLRCWGNAVSDPTFVDQSMTPENVATVERALDEGGVRYRSELYQGAAHGSTMADTPMYGESAAERHFAELFALLDRTITEPAAANRP